MGQRRNRLRFGLKSRERRRIGRHCLRHDFDRDVAIQPRVARAIDLAHAPGAERSDDLVGAEACADRKRHVR